MIEEPALPAKKAPSKYKVEGTGWYRQLNDDQAHIALGLRAAGWSLNKIRLAMQRTAPVIRQGLQRIPDAQEKIDAIRQHVRLDKMEQSVDVDALLWKRLKADVPTADAKDVDALFRSAYANEKVQQSIMGQAVKVDVTHAGIQPNVELNQMLVNLGIEGLREVTGE